MRLNLVNADVTVDNGNSNENFSADDNSNTTLSTDQNSAVIRKEKWAWKQGAGREDEHPNTLTYDSKDAYNSNCSSPEESPASETSSPTDSEGRESESDSEEEPRLNRKSFANPNYPGFQHLAHELNDSINNNYEGNNNNDGADKGEPTNDNKAIDYSLNILDKLEKPKEIYSRPKLDFLEVKEMNSEVEMRRSSGCREEDTLAAKDTDVKYETTGSEEAEKGEGDTKKSEKKSGGSSRTQHDKEIFDVYNIETAMPTIDLEAIESHLRAAREEERRRRNDREEIRRRLATGSDADEFYGGGDKPGKKPSLQARLQSGMNLQICFMNETSSDTESPSSESAPLTSTKNNLSSPPSSNGTVNLPMGRKSVAEPPKTLNLKSRNGNSETQDFFARQARLQAEARLALTQAKDRARLQMEADRISGKVSPITEMLRSSLRKVGVHFPPERRRVSRQMLTDMNVAQLQVIVNDLHTQIETLNEGLVKFLMERDELHMKQDSMLVDIEDISRYLGVQAEYQVMDLHNSPSPSKQNKMSEEVKREEILACFQCCTGICNMEEAIVKLNSAEWDLVRACRNEMSGDELKRLEDGDVDRGQLSVDDEEVEVVQTSSNSGVLIDLTSSTTSLENNFEDVSDSIGAYNADEEFSDSDRAEEDLLPFERREDELFRNFIRQIDNERNLENRKIIERQNEEFRQSLIKDREKELAKQKLREESERKQKETEEEAQRLREEIDKILPLIPEEPPEEMASHSLVLLKFRKPDGTIFQRRFHPSDTVQTVVHVLLTRGYPSNKFKYLFGWPRSDLLRNDVTRSLESLNFQKETLTIEAQDNN